MAARRHPPVKPTPSATLILARRHGTRIEVYLLRRSTASKFMPDTYVFPGGGLERDDMDTAFWLKHVDLPMQPLGRVLGGPVDRMLPFAVAAIRETYEEAGLLLTRPIKNDPTPEPLLDPLISFSRRVEANGLELAVSRLARWHHWITPESMPHRFETFFFVAAVDSEQRCRPDNRETVHGTWVDPMRALEKNARGSLPLSPPTLVTLHQMLPCKDLDDLMTTARSRSWPAPIMPRLWPLDHGALIVEPWDPDYTREIVSVDIDRLEKDVLPVGAPFSRLWRHRGVCRPVRHPDG